MFAHPRGSEWTQWDLHVHTPATLLSNAFEGATEDEKWDDYIRAVAKSGLQVIAPTNYFCLDGIDRVVAAKVGGQLGEVECVLPNIEFRIDQSNKDGSHIHVHVIFADRFSSSLQPVQDFLDSLELLMTTSRGKVERCTRDAIGRLGADKVLVPLKELDEKLRKSFERLDDYVVVAACRGLGNFRPGASDSRGDTVAIEIDRMCDLIYGSAADDRDFFLREDRYDEAVPKPVLLCSDAHDSSSVGSRRTWIRANPTFEGLMQAVFEPNLRVRLDDPSSEKSIYSSIESVRFTSPSGAEDMFQGEPILLNTDLTAIIGGKSTGKSLLLHYLARTLDETQVIDREAAVFGDDASRYSFHDEVGFDLEVKWSDGLVQTFSARSEESGGRRIVYIPQSFLNRICDLGTPTGGRSLDEFTREALEHRPSLATSFKALGESKDRYDRNTREALDRLFDHHKDYLVVDKEIGEAGDESGVAAELRRLDDEIGKLRDASKMSDEEKNTYDALSTDLATAASEEAELRSDNVALALAHTTAQRAVERLESGFADLLESLQNSELKATSTEALKGLRDLPKLLENAFAEIEEKSKDCSAKLTKRRVAAENILRPLASNVEGQKQLEILANKKNAESARLSRIKALAKKRQAHSDAMGKEVIVLGHEHDALIEAYSATCSALGEEVDALGDISYSAQLAFDSNAFEQTFVKDSVKVNSLKACLGVSGQYGFEFDPASHPDYIRNVAAGLLAGRVKCMKGIPMRHALEDLVENRLLIDYRIEYHGDRIEAMSPGKRALVVLKILLELSEDEWPILLDQPDDDLDSRSVYRELVQYFKDKKRSRQIVLVTHNPNLVVGADADSVVVANQSGQEPGRENAESRFEYVSGALESTFTHPAARGILHQQGIREHVCDVLEGGRDAFRERERKYRL